MPNLTVTHEAPLESDRNKLTTIILQRASDAARQILEDLMMTIEWKDDFVEGFVNQGRAEGREEGAITAKIGALMKVLSSRQLRPTKKQLGQVAQCTDLAKLDRWFERSLTAETAAEVFSD
jgi:hypothetical protein